MQRVTDPADPHRCKGHDQLGGDQCTQRAVDGGEYCLSHGGRHALARHEAAERRLYHLTQARSSGRVAELAQGDPTTFLYEITGLAVLLLEKMQRATSFDDFSFVTAYSDVQTLVTIIDKLKRATVKIQQNISVLVNKASLYDFGRLLTELTEDEVRECEDADKIVKRVSSQINQLIRASANEANVPSLESSRPLDKVPVFKLNNERDSERLAELRHHDQLMSLYEEIAIQIENLERRWNLVESDIELLAACSQLTMGLKNLERLIKSAHEQAQAIGELLSPVASRQVVLEAIAIATRELKQLPNFETSIDRLRLGVMGHFEQQALPPPDEANGSPS